MSGSKKIASALFLAPLLAFATPEEGRVGESFGKRLLDCSTFFGILSQSESKLAPAMKGFTVMASGYAVAAFGDEQLVESELKKSMASLADELPKLKQDKNAFGLKFESCLSSLKTAERELRPGMDEVMKALIPEVFGPAEK